MCIRDSVETAPGRVGASADDGAGQAVVAGEGRDHARGDTVGGHDQDPNRAGGARRQCATAHRAAMVPAWRGRHHHTLERAHQSRRWSTDLCALHRQLRDLEAVTIHAVSYTHLTLPTSDLV